MRTPAPIVISIGGSLVAPAVGIDVVFLKTLRTLIVRETKKGKRFMLIVGGGSTARQYMKAAQSVVGLTPDDMDWLGIHATRINGHLLRAVFRDVAHPVIVKDPSRKISWREPVLVAAGWKPGWSTDYVATRLAHLYGSDTVINLTNIERVYDKDPAKYADAKPFDRISWKDFRKIVGEVWNPGANAPFDPIASKLADRSGIRVIIAKGSDLKNVKKILDDKTFVGTVID